MSVWVLSVSALFGLGPVCLDLVCLEPLYISGSGPCLCEPYVYIYIYIYILDLDCRLRFPKPTDRDRQPICNWLKIAAPIILVL